ncbi:MAG: sodium:dicarboxylate symporter [Rickettsiales bacterium]|nr:sodium:dicarboxylate symporter [Rickettsiales bacterium]|tara:strand:+ start:902 stop:2272 length:1371 start_codon:yes stop_codon:yes gene_type:complete
MHRAHLLTGLILAGLIAGALFGQFVLFDPATPIAVDHWTRIAGDLVLIRPLTLLIVPLIFVSVISGVTSIGSPQRLGVVGGCTLLYYFGTMFLAVSLGTALVSTVRPGDLPAELSSQLSAEASRSFAAPEQGLASKIERTRAQRQDHLGGAWLNILRQLVPRNVIDDMANGRSLGVIAFAILLGLALAAGGEGARPAIELFSSLFTALMTLVLWVIWLCPLGVFFLVAWTVGRIGLAALVGPLSSYMLLVIAGLAVHGLVVLPAILWWLRRENPYRFMWQMRKALLTAFGTDSSAATLPVTIESAQSEGGCSRRAAHFVLPLGATINMDGTALYEAVAVVFLFQLHGIELGTGELLVVVVTATLAAVGAAGIPSAGLVTMVIVITAVNASLAGRGIAALPVSAIGVIIGVDRILDMCRTVVNVWGDAVGAKLISPLVPDPAERIPAAGLSSAAESS